MRTIFHNGTFLTMDDRFCGIEAVLVNDGVIEAVGAVKELRLAAADAKLYDMKGRTILPGFIDGHSHLSAVGYQLLIANLKPSPIGSCDSVADVVSEMREFLEAHPPAPGQWLLGMGYDNSAFEAGRHPTKEDLDEVSREIPVAVTHISGHMCVVNTKGMEILGYLEEPFEVPAGGFADPSGLLKEQAFIAKSSLMKGPSQAEVVSSVGKASELYASYGITTVQDGKAGGAEYALLKEASEKRLLRNDVVIYLTPEAAEDLLPRQFPSFNPYDGRLRAAGVKFFLDGSPQGKTAWLSEPYQQAPDGEDENYRGFPVQKEEDVLAVMRRCVKNSWQINIHANGDEAIEQMVRCYGQVEKETGAGADLRPVVIHCQTVREDQLDRMKELSMTASFFLDHVYYWGDYHRDSVLGPKRASRISPLKSALDRGIPFTLHQDSPVAPPNMLLSVHNAVNRRTSSGRVLGKEQRISVEDALKAVTCNAAFQIFEEDRKGSITPGKRADFVVLDRNPLSVPPDEIKGIQVLETIKDGETIYCAEKL